MTPLHSVTNVESNAKAQFENSQSEVGGRDTASSAHEEGLGSPLAPSHGSTANDQKDMSRMGKRQELLVRLYSSDQCLTALLY